MGFLVQDNVVLSCAHVLVDSPDYDQRPERQICLDFPFARPGNPIQAEVAFWNSDKDIAGLRLQIPAPSPARPLPLVELDETWGRPFRTLGFPSDYTETGVWAAGVLRSKIANDWIQIETTEAGFPIRPGFSGCPIWDDKEAGVIGMLVASDSQGRGAFVLPTSTIRTAWPNVQPLRPAPPPPTPRLPYQIFMCHASGDKTDVRKFYRRLTQDGFNVWFDEERLLPGQRWEPEIGKAVRGSEAVIVCLSTKSVSKTGFVQKEIRLALDAADEKPEDSVFLIPARLEECGVPDRLAAFQWVDLFTENGYERLVRALKLIEGRSR